MINPKLHLIIDENLRQKVVDFVHNEQCYFKNNGAGAGRKLCIVSKTGHALAEEIRLFSKKCYESLGISEYDDEPYFGNFIGVNQEGAFVHKHTDPTEEGKSHVRLNFLVQRPDSGGMPIINKIEYEIDQGECWRNIASSWEHGSTRVVGKKERIVLSLGALVKDTIVEERLLTDIAVNGSNI
jgi:hypothetical protein